MEDPPERLVCIDGATGDDAVALGHPVVAPGH